MMVRPVLQSRHASRVCSRLAVEQDRLAAWKNEPVPSKQGAVLPSRYFAVIFSDQPRALWNEQNAAGRAVIDVLGDLRSNLAREVRSNSRDQCGGNDAPGLNRSEEHTSELQSLMRISYAVFCLKKQ